MAEEAIRVGSITDVWTFLVAIDWEEPWLWILLTFHVSCAVMTLAVIVLSSHTYNIQIVLFLMYLGLVYCSEYINEWAAANYKLFSKQQYFDSQGLFISLLFSLPLLINTVVIVVFWMWDVTKVMFRLKKAKVVQRAKVMQGQKKDSNDSEEMPENNPDTITNPKPTEDKDSNDSEEMPENSPDTITNPKPTEDKKKD